MVVEMVSGDGFVSDESSFYGDEDEQARQLDLCDRYDPKLSWAKLLTDLNRVTQANRRQTSIKTMLSGNPGTLPNSPQLKGATSAVGDPATNEPSSIHGLDRKVMEQERLARLGKRKREASSEPPPKAEMFNIRAGHADAWQLGESASEFVERLSPATTSISFSAWIWVGNPHRSQHDGCVAPDVHRFINHGMELLEQSLELRQNIQSNGSRGHKAVLNKQLKQESINLQQRIADLAVENHVISGKWMLFPKSADVTQLWKSIVQGVIDNRIGPSAKVATNDGNDEHLICVYTKDFRDVDDVTRVLLELESMGFLSSGQTLYYKHDAFTYLDLKSDTARQFGLQASLYNSRTILAGERLSKSTAAPRQKQATLSMFF